MNDHRFASSTRGTEFGLQIVSEAPQPEDLKLGNTSGMSSIVMKKNLGYAVIGLTVGLVCGFKAANYGYRSELNANRTSAVNSAASLNPNTVGNGQRGQAVIEQVQASVEKARTNPQNFDAQHEAAHLFTQIQRPDSAIEFLLKAQQIKPTDPDTLAELAEAYYLTQKFDESINWARRALQAKPAFPIANYYLMASYIETNQNLPEAERILADLEALRPGDRALGEIRQLIQKAKLEGGKSKSVLAHGPETEAGGRR